MLTATTYLVLLIALLVSAFSLPNDFKSKTIYTVVTKPVRAGDIVLGRILGFTIVGTVLLAIMGVFSAVFVWRMLDHTHAVDVASLENDLRLRRQGRSARKAARRSTSSTRHEVEIYPDGTGLRALDQRARARDHVATSAAAKRVYEVSGPQRHVPRPRAGVRQAAVPRPQGRRRGQGHQRRQRVDLSQLHRRRHAGGRDLDVQRHQRVDASRRTRTASRCCRWS